ncbi:MAG: hypothetical protein J7K83_00010 [Candidatus Aenigmarchaeota archaeon]|nr:hypothetical protein [Candidatus Aenigmarchaeota archaeon]
MVKGLTEYLLKFILGVILVALAFFAMKKAYNEASTKIMEYLGIYRPSLLERAIACSYYRCYYDLNDPGSKQYTQEACSDFFEKGNYLLPAELDAIKQKTSSDYKICNEFSMANPVVVSLSKEKDAKLNKEMIKTFMKNLRCVVYNDTKISGKSIGDYVASVVFPIYGIYKLWESHSTSGDVVYLDLSSALLARYDTEECKIGGDVADPSLTSATLKAGDYYVYTVKKDGKYTTVVTKEKDPGYVKLLPGSPRSIKFEDIRCTVSDIPTSGDDDCEVNKWFLVKTPKGSKYLIVIESFDEDIINSKYTYHVKYDLVDDNKNFIDAMVSDGELLSISGCFDLKIKGDIDKSTTGGIVTHTTYSGSVTIDIELVSSSC